MAKKSTKKQNTPTKKAAKAANAPKQVRVKKTATPAKRKKAPELKVAIAKSEASKALEPTTKLVSEKLNPVIHNESVVSCRQLVLVKSEPEETVHSTPTEVEQPQHDASSQSGDDANALYILGIRYSTGRDVEQDLVAAHKWFNLAVMLGHEEARTCRADISREMTKAQIARAQKEARAWLDNRDKKNGEGENAPAPVVKRPIYVRRHAQAMRSAQSFARLCACA